MTTAERRITTTDAPDAEAGAASRAVRRTGPVGPSSVDPAHWPDIAAVPPASASVPRSPRPSSDGPSANCRYGPGSRGPRTSARAAR